MLLVEMVHGQLLDPINAEPIDGSKLMADPDRRDLPYVFPPDGTKAARSPANRMLLDREYGSSARGVLKSRLEKVETLFGGPQEKLRFFAALESHGIDEAACEAIQLGNLAEFVQAREAQLQRQEGAFLKKFDLSIGDAVERSEDEVDVDEE
jgi:hypothetical protein